VRGGRLSEGRSLRGLTVLIVAGIAWGALAFGAVYAWAFTPLLIVCLTVGAWCCAVDTGATLNKPVAISLLAIGLTGALQLIPLTRSTLQSVSPATDRVLQHYDVQYANSVKDPHVLSIDPPSTGRGLIFFASFGLLLVGLSRMLTRRQVALLAMCTTGLGAVIALVGIVQRATFNGKIYGFWQPHMASTPFGPFINRNHFAGWMLMALPLAVGLFCGLIARGMDDLLGPGDTARDVDDPVVWRRRLLWCSSPDASRIILIGFAIVAMALSLVLSLSRLGLCGITIALLIGGRFAVRNRKQRAQRIVAYGYVLLFVIVSVASLWAGVEEGVARFTDPGARDLGGRLPIWEDTVRIVRDFPLTGTGLNTYGTAMLFYQTTLPNEHVREAHNDYLQLAAEGGLFLGVPIAIAVMIFVREVYLRFREKSDELTVYWIRTGAVAGLAAIALQSIGEFSLQMPGNALLFTTLCAIALHKSQRHPPVVSSHR
jgi:O-antigen ligase